MSLALLSLFGCRALDGPFGFAVHEAVIIPCVTEGGAPLAIAYVTSVRKSDRCFDSLDEPPEIDGPLPGHCERIAPTVQDPNSGVCDTSPNFISDRREQLQWVWELDEADRIEGAVAEEADHSTCGGPWDDEDGPNTHAELVGSLEVVEDRGGTAVVELALDGTWGTYEFEVCR